MSEGITACQGMRSPEEDPLDLPPMTPEIVMMRGAGLHWHQIAELQGLPVNTVKELYWLWVDDTMAELVGRR